MDSYNNPMGEFVSLMRGIYGVDDTFEFSALSEGALSAVKVGSCSFTACRRAGGFVYRIHYPNGFGASILKYFGTYGAEHDLWEVAVLREEGGKWHLCYDTDITYDVLGHQEEKEVIAVCDAIRSLT